MNIRCILRFLFRVLVHYQFVSKCIPDKLFLGTRYWLRTGKKINWNNPQTFNEKMQWLKVYNRKKEYTQLVDKYKVREFINDTIGEEYLIPLIGVWDSPDDICFNSLPDQFVLKCNHNSGLGMCICRNKKDIQEKQVKKELKKGLKQDYYISGREWPYKDVKRRIVAEEFIQDGVHEDLRDYKVFVFNGKAYYIQVDIDRFTNHRRNFYTTNWEYVPFTTLYPTDPTIKVERPKQLNQLIEVSEQLAAAAGTPPFVRIDMYLLPDKMYFGEITFFHGGGGEPFYPESYNLQLGNLIKLPI